MTRAGMSDDGMPGWPEYSRITTSDTAEMALRAAAADMRQMELSLSGASQPALTWTCRGDATLEDVVVTVTGAPGRGQEVRVHHTAVRTASSRAVPPITLLACALAADEPLGPEWEPVPVGNARPPSRETFDAYERVHQPTTADLKATRALSAGQDVILTGNPGSGKTIIAAERARACMAAGYGLVWLDFTDPTDGAESVFLALLTSPRRDRYLVVVDNVQSNPSATRVVFDCIRMLRATYGLAITVLATGWATLTERWPAVFADFTAIPARGSELINLLLADRSIPPEAQSRISRLAGGDVHIAVAALRLYRENPQRVPTPRDLQEDFTKGVQDPQLRQALYWFACLGYFEIPVPLYTAEYRWPASVVQELAHRELIRFHDGVYVIGHKERAKLVLRHALCKWGAEAWGKPSELVWQHLRMVGETLIRITLARLDLVGVRGDQQDRFQRSTQYLAAAYDMILQLERQLERVCTADHTWGDNVAAAIFAAKAMALLDRDEQWEKIAGYVRSRWHYLSRTELPAPNGRPSADYADFDKIIHEMEVEDAQLKTTAAIVEPAKGIDKDRFYRTWMLGMLLLLEGSALQPDRQRLEALIAVAARERDADGFFYPRRVPWVTARVVLGLCQAGQTYDSNETVRLACDWLRRPVSVGGPLAGWWRSGTGNWNRQEATTALCLTALRYADLPSDGVGSPIETALAWLGSREWTWRNDGREIDLALVAEAFLLCENHGHHRYQLIVDLLEWAHHALRALPGKESADAGIPEAELRVPFVAAQLTGLVRSILTRETSVLLDDMVRLAGSDDDFPDVTAPQQRPAAIDIADPAGPELRDIDVVKWKAACELLVRTLDDRLRELRPAVDRYGDEIPDLYEMVLRYQEYRSRCVQLMEQLAAKTSAEVLLEIGRMGREVCGSLWPPDLDGSSA